MNIRGYFMLLMSTIWRTVVTQLKATFRFRLAGGSDNALLPERNGMAVIDTIYGNTVKWNQLIDITTATINRSGLASELTAVESSDGSLTINGTTTATRYLTIALTDVKGHVASVGLGTSHEHINFNDGNSGSNRGKSRSNWSNYATNYIFIYFDTNTTFSNFKIYPQFNDLTTIFGTNAEIAAALGIAVADITTATGVAAFESWLALNGGAQDYYPYDEGSLISFTGSGVKSVGWNKFHVVNGSGVADVKKDVKYYVAGPFGSLHYSDGTAISVASDRTFTAIKDDTIIFGSVSNSIVLNIYTGTAKDGTYEPYHEEIVDLSGAYINVWDEEWEPGGIDWQTGVNNNNTTTSIRSKGYIEVSDDITYYAKYNSSTRIFLRYYNASKTYIGQGILNNDNTFTPLANTAYLRFQLGSTNYPVSPQVYNYDVCINVSNADINGTYFPHALQSAGSATDEDTETELTKKLTEVRLGELTWSYVSGLQCFRSTAPNLKAASTASTVANGKCSKYPIVSWSNIAEGTMSLFSTGGGRINVRDSNYGTDASVFTQAMKDQNVKLIYELTIPIVVPHDIPMQYAVDKYCTEEVVVPTSADGAPTSTNIVADIEYQAK